LGEKVLKIEDFVHALKERIEASSSLLNKGGLFLPEFLKGKVFTNKFPMVVEPLGEKLKMPLKREHSNRFSASYDIKYPQRVDYAFFKENGTPYLFLEVESLNRSQCYLFMDAQLKPAQNDNKLWYYHGTLENHFVRNEPIPRYFVFFLVLPDREVSRYQLWDFSTYKIFHPSLRAVVFENPYIFYDRQIKALARAFLNYQLWFNTDTGFKEFKRSQCEKACELIFITCTIDRLILSRGQDLFDPEKEKSFKINWNSKRNDLPAPLQIKASRTKGKTTYSSKKELPRPLTQMQTSVLRRLLPLVAQSFVGNNKKYVSDNSRFFEIYWGMIPGQKKKKECYSLGFMKNKNPEPLYWTVPRISLSKDKKFLSKGFEDTEKNLWKYIYIPIKFWDMADLERVSWLEDRVNSLLQEDKELRESQ